MIIRLFLTAKQTRFLITCMRTKGSHYPEFREIYHFIFLKFLLVASYFKIDNFHFFDYVIIF